MWSQRFHFCYTRKMLQFEKLYFQATLSTGGKLQVLLSTRISLDTNIRVGYSYFLSRCIQMTKRGDTHFNLNGRQPGHGQPSTSDLGLSEMNS